MPRKKVTIEDFDARMEEIRGRHKKPVVPTGGLKDRLRQAALKRLPRV